ncbi:unnamed protein product [Microthlaspi erraticum]|uniref:Uncharacterized protein n=1 Tax=Microthlaspi erraticum TaxID=1685480 RepID=A0A6D2J3V3_9BRAS|nr:unnamed protein product [Microthlaspi erraticum]
MKELETERKKLDERERRIKQQETNKNKDVMGKSRLDIEMNEKAMLEQDEEAMKLAEKHQKEKQNLYAKIIEMEANLNETQVLELEIEKLTGDINVMKHMVGISDRDAELFQKISNF